jgi:hypothetical protein
VREVFWDDTEVTAASWKAPIKSVPRLAAHLERGRRG